MFQCCPAPGDYFLVPLNPNVDSDVEHLGASLQFLPSEKGPQDVHPNLLPESAAWFDAATTLCVRAAAGMLLGRLCPCAPALARAPEKRHVSVSISVLTSRPPPTFHPRAPPRAAPTRLRHTHHLALPSRLGALAPTTQERCAPSTHFSERRLVIDSEWSPWTSGRALREWAAVEQSIARLEYIARWESREPTRDAYRRRTVDVDLRAQRHTSLPSSHRFPALVVSLPRALAGTCSSHRPHTPTLPAAHLDSHAAPGAAPPTRVLLASRTATLRPRFTWDRDGYELARARSLPHPYRTRARSLPRAYFVARVPSHVVRARLLATVPPPISPALSGHAPSHPATRTSSSLVYPGLPIRGAGVDGKAGIGMGMKREGAERVGGNGGKEGTCRCGWTKGEERRGWVVGWGGVPVRGYAGVVQSAGADAGVRREGGDGQGGERGGEGGSGIQGALRPQRALDAPAERTPGKIIPACVASGLWRRRVLLAPPSRPRVHRHAVPAFCIECRRARGTVCRRSCVRGVSGRRTRANPLVTFILVRPLALTRFYPPLSLVPLVFSIYLPRPIRIECELGLGADAVAVCALHLRVPAHIEGCWLSVSSAECRMRADAKLLIPVILVHPCLRLSPSHPPSPPLVVPPLSPCIPRPLSQVRTRTRRGCRGRVCALPARVDGAEQMCGGVVRGPGPSLLARARCWADTAALPYCIRAPPISSPVPPHPMPPALYPRPLESPQLIEVEYNELKT
ncbi:hypothetical protein C8F04DRAFT_1338321 [Mycena alexandri]|uniref:Uncharacterized protein n=1 Tax=Mycena alexandri TaxID=1745969 RepID=A0AAD6WLP0_9AGAR|nr:hypothetical protein C8F04DRAFT_1338321 [Mycena alexandri]